MPSAGPGVALRRGPRFASATMARGLIALAASALALPALAQWTSDLEACGREALSPEQRIEVCNKALQSPGLSAPDRATTYNNLGVAWKAKGDLDQAIANYGKAIAAEPGLAKAFNNRGVALGAKGDMDAAIRG